MLAKLLKLIQKAVPFQAKSQRNKRRRTKTTLWASKQGEKRNQCSILPFPEKCRLEYQGLAERWLN